MKKDKKKQAKKGKKKGGKSDWLAPMSRKQATKHATKMAELEFGSADRDAASEVAASQYRQTQIPSWFQNYTDKLGEMQRSSQGYYDKATEGLAAGPGQDAAKLVSANQLAYLSDQQRIGTGQGNYELLQEAARERALRGDQRELSEQRGLSIAEQMAELRQQEREFGLSQQEFGEEAKGRRSQRKLAKQYGQNKKREQKRGLKSQLKVAQAQAANKSASQSQSLAGQLKVAKLQGKIGKKGDKRSLSNQKKIANLQAKIGKKGDKRSHRLFPPQGGGSKKKKKGKGGGGRYK